MKWQLYFLTFALSFPFSSFASDNSAEGRPADSVLIKKALAYMTQHPAVFLDLKPIDIDSPEFKKIAFDPKWFSVHRPSPVSYVPKDKWPPPYQFLNDHYAIYWLFMPGCEQRPEDKISEPNWFNADGIQCMGGYSVQVIFNHFFVPDRLDVQTVK